jgi:hypothetical protein
MDGIVQKSIASSEEGIIPNSHKTAKLDAVLFTPKIYFANFTCNNTG